MQDPLKRVADTLAGRHRVLCLDELFVTDVADAMILARLFDRLFDVGLVLVATSNRVPEQLYENGLQRQQFVPFIHRLARECAVHDMESTVDYRRLAKRTVGSYFVRLVEGRSNDDRLTSVLKQVRRICYSCSAVPVPLLLLWYFCSAVPVLLFLACKAHGGLVLGAAG